MSGKRELDPMQMCRICAVDVADDSGSHLLIEDNRITELGGIFISCLGIQVSGLQQISFVLCIKMWFFFFRIAHEGGVPRACL